MPIERVAIYPGSFDPPTLGHHDLIVRASRLFDRVVIGVARNIGKAAMFSEDERVEMLREMAQEFPNVEVESFQTLTVDFALAKGACAIIRGLRVLSDFEYELTLAINNHKLNADIDTVCLMPSELYVFLSSTIVKEIALFDGDFTGMVPAQIAERIKAKVAERKKAQG